MSRSRHRRMRGAAALGAVAAIVLAACSGEVRLPAAVTAPAPATTSAPVGPTPTTAPDVSGCTADNALRSFRPNAQLPAPLAMPDKSTMKQIQDRGRLIVGVSADSLLFGARNPLTGVIEGFDIDVLKQVALAIFGPGGDSKIEYRVITYAERLPVLETKTVDLVAHSMTINCARWQRIAFSSEYYAAGQKILVKKGSGITSADQLADEHRTVCAPNGSTNIDNINAAKYIRNGDGLKVIARDDVTDCLVAVQQGDADAATGDDTVLAGFAVQDPNTEVVGDPISSEPYGVGVNSGERDLVEFVNGVLEQMRSDGRWTAIYTKWLIDTGALKLPVPAPPTAQYGRP